jgi:hypothetical protein
MEAARRESVHAVSACGQNGEHRRHQYTLYNAQYLDDVPHVQLENKIGAGLFD